jgi:hypothetical protein
MRLIVILLLFVLLISCSYKDETPTNNVFGVNPNLSVKGLLHSGYIKNKYGFPVIIKKIGDTTFIYEFNHSNITKKSGSFELDSSFSVKEYFKKGNCIIIDSSENGDSIIYKLKNRTKDLDFLGVINKHTSRLEIIYYYPILSSVVN